MRLHFLRSSHASLRAVGRYTGIVPPRKRPMIAQVEEYIALAMLLPIATFVGLAIGYLLDRAFGTHFLYIVFMILGVAGGFLQLIRRLLEDTRNDES
jgi:F0F1-type ATP synthase assembly protein I